MAVMQVDWMPAAVQLVVENEPGAGEPGAAGHGAAGHGETPAVGVAEQGPAEVAGGGASGEAAGEPAGDAAGGAAGAAGGANGVGDPAVGNVTLAAAGAADVVGADAPKKALGQVAEQQAALAQQLPAAEREGPPQQ